MDAARQEFVVGSVRALPGVVSMVGYRSRGLPESTHLGVPSATLTVVLSFDGPVVGADTAADLAAGRTVSCDVVLAGLHERAAHLHRPAREEGLQLALSPLAARAMLGMPAAQLPGGLVEGSAPTPLVELWRRAGEPASWESRFGLVADAVQAWVTARERCAGPRPDVAQAWRVLARSRGSAAIDDVARAVLLSPRQLRQEFRREFGVSPKGAARLMRFDHALALMTAAVHARRTPSLARVAADCGYSDQSHFIRETRGYLGVPPGRWVEEERRNIHDGGHRSHADSTHDLDASALQPF